MGASFSRIATRARCSLLLTASTPIPQRRRHLRRGEALHVAQHEHLAIRPRQLGHRALDRVAHLAPHRRFVGAGRGIGQLVRLLRAARVLSCAARSPLLLLDGEAPRDGEQPRAHRRLAAEAAQAARRGEERLLQHLARVLLVLAHGHREAEHGALVAGEQRLGGPRVPGLRRGDELGVALLSAFRLRGHHRVDRTLLAGPRLYQSRKDR
jgi:hypothetical protein